MGILEALRVGEWTSKLDMRWILAYYVVVLLMPVGMLAASGIWTPILATGIALILPMGGVLSRMNVPKPAVPTALVEEQVR